MTAPILVIVKNRILRCFQKAGVISAETAVHLEDIKVKKVVMFDCLVKKDIEQKTTDGRYYLVK